MGNIIIFIINMFWTSTVTSINSMPVEFGSDNVVLHVSQACLTSSKGSNTLIVNTEDKKATLCVLNEDKFPFSSLDLYFTKEENPKFSLLGSGEICLSG